MKSIKAVQKTLFDFGIEIIELYKILVFHEKEFIFSKRLLKAGTGIGFEYSCGKINKAWKKAVETKFWLEIVKSMWDLTNHSEEINKESVIQKINSISDSLTGIFYFFEKRN